MKRLSLYTTFVLALTVVIAGFRFVDEQFLERLKSKLTAFNQQYPEERIYLQFDKTFFKPGEIVWYKAYVLNGTTLAPTTVSTAMYVELVDPRGAVVKKSELYVEDGAAHGDFMISQGMPGGLYTVRAFTRWMQNFQKRISSRKRSRFNQLLRLVSYSRSISKRRPMERATPLLQNSKHET
ncbi:MAG: MG2 domain-containing protein [Bacteroidota bacterium]